MRHDSTRALLSCAVLVALAAGCASTQSSNEAADASPAAGEDLHNRNESIEAILQRKAPGLLISRTSDGVIAIQIRGTSSYTGAESPPLYVLDGAPFQPGRGGALTGIDPYQIESIKLVRSAEAGLYGIDGAHGVIVITTRRPKKSYD